jgi:hypothetical protein
MQLPIIAKATPTFMKALPWLFSELQLTPDDEFLVRLNSVFSTSSVYSTGYANHPRYYKFKQQLPFEPITEFDLSSSKPLDDVVATRALYIILQNRPLKVFWSGGIDSTLTTAAILANADYKDQISIYHTCESIRENPHFYDYILKHNVKTVMWSDYWGVPFEPNDIVVTGTSSDEITGSLDDSFYYTYQDQLSLPWQTHFEQRGFSNLIDRCQELFAQSHAPIETVFDARWWFYFYIRQPYYARRDWDVNLENDFSSAVVQFFNCPDFDAWAAHNKSTLVGPKYSDYKKPFKQATSVYWNNTDYINNKEKVNSYITSIWIRKKIALLNQHYLFIYADQQGNHHKFVPKQTPFVSKQQVLDALNAI